MVLLALIVAGWVAALMLLIGLPTLAYLTLSWQSRRQMRQIVDQLPSLLDYSVRSLKAGRTLNDAVLGGIDSSRDPCAPPWRGCGATYSWAWRWRMP